MLEINAANAAAYLRETGRVPEGRAVEVEEMGGGVSNIVLKARVEGQPPLVLKQSRERLRTKMEWLSRLDRIWTEQEALELIARLVPDGAVPEVLFDDRPNYLFAMTCAPEGSQVWKALLLAGEADPEIARQAGSILGSIHAGARGRTELTGRLADTTLFDQLRLDPYYRTIARVHPDLAEALADLIEPPARVEPPTLVLGDFSPKNILVRGRTLMLVDFETAHAGDSAFDLGFFLSHLLLKSFRASPRQEPYVALTTSFWAAYRSAAGEDRDLTARAIRHAAACVLARLDGKSPVDYLDQLDTDEVRRFARTALLQRPPDWPALLELAAWEMRAR